MKALLFFMLLLLCCVPGRTGELPFGEFATPVDGAMLTGSVAVTGWALDDQGVEKVIIQRRVGAQYVYIGEAVFVEGERPDIEQAFPGYPNNSRAGWGYMMLTNMLPDQGNGTFILRAVAVDLEGNEVSLGGKTVFCDNANSDKPFGAIDFPPQGGTVSGGSYRCMGWVLTQSPNKIAENGSGIQVYIGNTPLGPVQYGVYRPDIAELFPGYPNSQGALFYVDFDTTTFTNGRHQVQLVAADDAGNAAGIGSHYFFIQNQASEIQVTCTADPATGEAPLTVDFTASATGGSGGYSFVWDYGDDNAGKGATISHTYLSAGTYTAVVTVTSGGLTGTCRRTVTVVAQETGDYYVSTSGNDNNSGKSRTDAFRTLDRAFEAVAPGQTILLMEGTYSEEVTLNNLGNASAAITLRGETGAVLDGNETKKMGIWCDGCTNLVFDNFTVRDYTDVGVGATLCSQVTIRNLTVAHNGFAVQRRGWELEGYGIHVEDSKDILIEQNDAYENGPDPQLPDLLMGTGINTYGNTDCTIRNNKSHDNTGGGLLVEDSINVLVEGNTVYDNDCDAGADEWWDAGLWVDGGHHVTVRNNTFTGNLGAGIEISDEDDQSPYAYVLENNTCTGNYFGIYIWNFGTTGWPAENILKNTNNRFEDNTRKDVWIQR